MDGIEAPRGEIVCEISQLFRQFHQFRPRHQVVATIVAIEGLNSENDRCQGVQGQGKFDPRRR